MYEEDEPPVSCISNGWREGRVGSAPPGLAVEEADEVDVVGVVGVVGMVDEAAPRCRSQICCRGKHGVKEKRTPPPWRRMHRGGTRCMRRNA